MKNFIFLTLFIFCSQISAREVGQTEITTEEGIEVFKKEKYYLLKKNVEIISDEFQLNANIVKAYFDKDLYDIKRIDSEGNVKLVSINGIRANGEKINYDVKNQNLRIYGKKSSLINNDIEMYSDQEIVVNNTTGAFSINGPNSLLKNDEILIKGSSINGQFSKNNNQGFEKLDVQDNNEINIKTSSLDMYALKAIYDMEKDLIELFDNVKIFRNNESITGDYAKINTKDESYKVTSNNTEKVKILLNNNE